MNRVKAVLNKPTDMDLEPVGQPGLYWTNVSHCLSEPGQSPCTLHANWTIVIIVVVLNTVKLLGMIYVVLWVTDEPLLTTGDAIQSYLIYPDVFTQRRCLTSVNDVLNQGWWTSPKVPKPEQFGVIPNRWRDAASKTRWLMFLSM